MKDNEWANLILFHPHLYLLSHITLPIYLCWFYLIYYYFLLCCDCTFIVFLTFSHYTVIAIIHFTDIILVSLLSPLSYNYLFNPYSFSNPTYISPFHILHSLQLSKFTLFISSHNPLLYYLICIIFFGLFQLLVTSTHL